MIKNQRGRFLLKKWLSEKIVGDVGTNNKSNRDKWLKKTLGSIKKGSKILDAGAGELRYKKYCNHLQYVSQDFGGYDGQGDDVALQTSSWDNTKLDIVSDITDIPENDASFDAVMCVEVFEHLPNPGSAIKEFSRLLKKGGTLIITAPFASLTHFSPYHFGSGYNKYFYEYYFKLNGLEIIEIERNGNYFDYIAQEIRRIPSVQKKYTPSVNKVVVFLMYIFSLGMLKILSVFSRNGDKSGELLCYGYHVIARKKKN